LTFALDATYSMEPDLTGVGVYSRAILLGLAAAYPDDRFLFCYRPHRFLRSLSTPTPGNARRALLRSGGIAPWRAAVFHSLNQRVDRRPCPRVVSTFHDLFVLTEEYSTPEFRRRFADQARRAAERSDAIIAVSQFTAAQVRDLLGVEPERTRVIHHGVDRPLNIPDESARENLILHVGSIQKRKNILRLVEAFETTPAGWRLVLAGGAGFGAQQILDRIAHSKRAHDIEWTGYVNQHELERFYARASIFAFPSLGEGFGMPVLDAMARGVPVVASRCGALPEVGGDAVLYADAQDVDSIREALRRLMESPELRVDFRRRGLDRSTAFSWNSAVQRTWQVYKDLL
jgi:glycosyltransferase involved in cell wall biosynthesis